MFKFFFSKSRTKDAIANAFAIAIAVLSVLSVVSCSTPRMATVVRETTRDTLYLNHIQYDSIYVYQGVEKDYRRDFHQPSSLNPQPLVDTIYVEKVRLEYKYKLLRDTVRVVQIDSIPVIREVEVIKTERYVPWYAKALSWIGVITLLLIGLWLVKKVVMKC